MKTKIKHLDLVIIGDGIYGSCCAYLAGKNRKRSVNVFSAKNAHRSTNHNSAWAQSGILQLFWQPKDKLGRSLITTRLRNSLRQLKHITAPYLFHDFGIVDVSDLGNEDDFAEQVRLQGFRRDELHQLNPFQARNLLGDVFYNPKGNYYKTPDAVFDLDKVSYRIRYEAQDKGQVEFVEFQEKIVLEPYADVANGVVIHTESGSFTANDIILAAGASNVKLLAEIGLKAKLNVSKVSLLKLPEKQLFGLNAKVLYNYNQSGNAKMTVVVHGNETSDTNDFIVLGTGKQAIRYNYNLNDPNTCRIEREEKLSAKDIQGFVNAYPPALAPHILGDEKQVNHCYLANGEHKYTHYVEEVRKGLIYGVPGLASMAYHTAQETVNQLQKTTAKYDIVDFGEKSINVKEQKSWFRKRKIEVNSLSF